jgi:hypothetical protein
LSLILRRVISGPILLTSRKILDLVWIRPSPKLKPAVQPVLKSRE